MIESPNCLLCNEKDTQNHFLSCLKSHTQTEHKDIMNIIRYDSKNILPGPMWKITQQILTGQVPHPLITNDKFSKIFNNCYARQSHIGWNNYIKGRIHKNWYKVYIEWRILHPTPHKLLPEQTWLHKTCKYLISSLQKVWKTRCDLQKQVETMKTQKEALREAHKLWKTQKKHNLLFQDKHLHQKQHPDTKKSLNHRQT